MVGNSESGSDFLNDELEELSNHIAYRDVKNTKVSNADVAWHLDHCLKTINRIYEALESSNPKEFKSNFSLSRSFVYAWGDFPRGVAKAPKLVRPPEIIETTSLYEQLEEAKQNLKKLERLDAKVHFEHPYFKVIDKRQTKRFLKIHTKHHLKIIRDIVKKPSTR